MIIRTKYQIIILSVGIYSFHHHSHHLHDWDEEDSNKEGGIERGNNERNCEAGGWTALSSGLNIDCICGS